MGNIYLNFCLWQIELMHDKELYRQILDIESPWEVTEVEVKRKDCEVVVHVEWNPSSQYVCPECGKDCAGYDHRERRWRHLDTCQYRTILSARVPRVTCKEHGVRQVNIPWSEPGSRFTALFERLVIDWLKEANTKAVSEQMHLSWDEVDGIMQRAVERGIKRREVQRPKRIGVDETSYQKRHEYVTVLNDMETGTVIDVLNDRKQETLEKGLESLGSEVLAGIEVVSLDMWRPYISAIKKVVPEADKKIAFDRFHIAQHIGAAVDKVRRGEHRVLSTQGDSSLSGSKFIWLKAFDKLDKEQEFRLDELCKNAVKTARAWMLKEFARGLWNYTSRTWARKAWERWYSKAIRSRLEPIKKVARMIKTHLDGIINAIVLNATNSRAEGINARIQWLKKSACGFRNRERFRNSILFHLGGLQLYPETQRL